MSLGSLYIYKMNFVVTGFEKEFEVVGACGFGEVEIGL
jgi:hypothetical protein